eukprot:CAMPEP_0171314726 /NCGR_PEP_ID=MMETSP0816-20121228/56575_1 /TAXON_ID=420281 /ORGANISM="Proboscia inermis, Strain CCAP1064/1" /LENGTH=64 /DNA_ID=CAMNT_0011804209 /DNA_START=323 /DNA_END=517 /DNA_ORIENTATION=+
MNVDSEMWTQKESFVREVLAREMSQVGDIYPFLELVRGGDRRLHQRAGIKSVPSWHHTGSVVPE